MRRNGLAAVTLMILAALAVTGLLAGCGRQSAPGGSSSTLMDGRTITVSIANSTELEITLDGQRYTYTRTLDGTNSSVHGPAGASSADCALVDKAVAQWLLDNPQWGRARRTDAGMVFGGLLMIGLGVFSLMKPATIWYISDGWKFRNAEPSDLALSFTRFGGVIMIIVGVILTVNAG